MVDASRLTLPAGCLCLLLGLLLAGGVRAAEPEPEQRITGKLETETEASDAARAVGNVALWLPRNVVDLLFKGTAAAANLVADEQLVPRYQKLLGAPPGGQVLVFPTLFAETGSPFSIGARMIVDTEHVTTAQRVGFGGLHDVAVESRVIFKGGVDFPAALSLESFYELESEIEYHGIGLQPETDPRNQFRPGTPHDAGLYRERHVRGLGSVGLRLSRNFEQFISASLARRQVEDSDAGDEALSQVFEPGSIAGVRKDTWIGYAEMALRFDSRDYRARPTPGALLEAYSGGAHSVMGATVAFMRYGGRVAGFIPIYRRTNILSPRIVYDRLLPLGNLEVPFNELPRTPDFRGPDTVRDYVSIVASLDYTWLVVKFLGVRLFLDVATVAPSMADFALEQIEHLKYAGGFGLDLYTDKAQLMRFQLAASPDGARVHFSLGTPEGFGDRQHRE